MPISVDQPVLVWAVGDSIQVEEGGQFLALWPIYGVIGCASTAQITSGGRTHPRRLLVGLGSLRASELGNRLGRSLAIKPTDGG